MSTMNPWIIRMATREPGEREILASELARRGITTHDNVIDFLLQVIRAGAATAEYMIASASRETSSDAAARLGAVANWLWGTMEPRDASRGEVLHWVDHAVFTLAAFSPNAEQLATTTAERVTSVGFLTFVDEAQDGQAGSVSRLVDAGRRAADRVDYNAVRDARRARNPWSEIEELNYFETVAGDMALVALVGNELELVEIEKDLDPRRDIRSLTDRWALPVAAHSTASKVLSGEGAITAPRPTGAELIADFANSAAQHGEDDGGQMLVWFGTDREPICHDGVVDGYENRPSSPRKVAYGRCVVNVPKAHRFGEVRTPWWDRVVRRSGDGRLRLRAIEELESSDEFAASVNDALVNEFGDERAALIYIHGYNTSFEAAALRSAQLGFDLNVDGITGFYSWPSAAKAQKYARDADNVAASEPPFAEFLDTLVSKTGINRLNFIVHSMGNRLVAEALQSVAPKLRTAGVRLGSIVLAAPDMNVDRFRQLASAYPLVAASTTMYVSESDLALGASQFLWDSPRAGLTPPITVVTGVDTIEVTDIDVSRLGHGYYGAAHPVLYDIREVIRGVSDPRRRVRLRELHDTLGAAYWQLTL
jgi:esterase/lipase superfamily enzyme